MLVEEKISKLVNVVEKLPDEKFSQLLNYAMFLTFTEKQIAIKQIFISNNKENRDSNSKESLDNDDIYNSMIAEQFLLGYDEKDSIYNTL